MARHALIMVCDKAPVKGPRKLQASLVEGKANRWVEALSSLGDLSFSWPGSKKPIVLKNPTRGRFTDLLDDTEFEAGDELLFYYFGHSYPVGPSKIAPAFDKSNPESLKQDDFEWVLRRIFNHSISKVYAILDTCHSGLLQPNLQQFHGQTYCMMAAENGYTKGTFSDHLLKGLSSADDDVLRLLHDNRAGGLTFSSLFEYGSHQMASELDFSAPKAFGALGDTLIREGERGVPSAFRSIVKRNSSYKKTYDLLNIFASGVRTFEEVMTQIKQHDSFVIRHDDSLSGDRAYVSHKTIQGYIKFLSAIRFLKNPRQPYGLTETGQKACSNYEFNGLLVEAIIEHLFPPDVDLRALQMAVLDLLSEGTPSDSINVSRYLRAKGSHRIMDPKNFNLGFRVLGYSGVFRRAPQALFPI